MIIMVDPDPDVYVSSRSSQPPTFIQLGFSACACVEPPSLEVTPSLGNPAIIFADRIRRPQHAL
jgi:hypothetical protein